MNIITAIDFVNRKPYGTYKVRRAIWEKGCYISVQLIVHDWKSNGVDNYLSASNRVRYYYPSGDHEDFKPSIPDVMANDWEVTPQSAP